MFLDNGGDGWRFGLALDHRVLGDFKGLVVCIEQPLEGLCFGRRGEGDSFLLTRLGVAPADRERSRSVRFFSLPNAGLGKNSRLRVHTKRGFVCTLRGPKGPLRWENTVPEVGLEPHSRPRKRREVQKTCRARRRPTPVRPSPTARMCTLCTPRFWLSNSPADCSAGIPSHLPATPSTGPTVESDASRSGWRCAANRLIQSIRTISLQAVVCCRRWTDEPWPRTCPPRRGAGPAGVPSPRDGRPGFCDRHVDIMAL